MHRKSEHVGLPQAAERPGPAVAAGDMAQKRLELIGARQLHPAESVQNLLERLKDAARFGTVARIRRKDQGWGVLAWINRKDPA